MHALVKTLNWSRVYGPQAVLHGTRWGGGGGIFYQAELSRRGTAEREGVSPPLLEASKGRFLPLGSRKGSARLQDNTWGGGSREGGTPATWSVWCPARVSTRVLLTCRCWDRRLSVDAGGGSCLRSQASWARSVPVTLEPTACHSRTEAPTLRQLARLATPAPRQSPHSEARLPGWHPPPWAWRGPGSPHTAGPRQSEPQDVGPCHLSPVAAVMGTTGPHCALTKAAPFPIS